MQCNLVSLVIGLVKGPHALVGHNTRPWATITIKAIVRIVQNTSFGYRVYFCRFLLYFDFVLFIKRAFVLRCFAGFYRGIAAEAHIGDLHILV